MNGDNLKTLEGLLCSICLEFRRYCYFVFAWNSTTCSPRGDVTDPWHAYVSPYTCVLDVMRSWWCSSAPAGRAPSLSGWEYCRRTAGKQLHCTRTQTATRMHNLIFHTHTHTHTSLPWVPPSHTLIYFSQLRQEIKKKLTSLGCCSGNAQRLPGGSSLWRKPCG